MIEKFSCYKFEVFSDDNDKHWYKIYGEGCPPYDDGVIESDDIFDSPERARYAAIGHITLLENGGQ